MFKGIRDHFQQRAEKKAARKEFRETLSELSAAIQSKDNVTAGRLLDEVKASPLYGPAAQETLLHKAISVDNEPIFSQVLDGMENPNIVFRNFMSTGPGGPMTVNSEEHILHAALRAGSHDIALALAKNEKVAVNTSGQRTITTFGAKTAVEIEAYKKPLTLAKEQGMHDVASALAHREALAYAVEARAERRKAAQQKQNNL